MRSSNLHKLLISLLISMQILPFFTTVAQAQSQSSAPASQPQKAKDLVRLGTQRLLMFGPSSVSFQDITPEKSASLGSYPIEQDALILPKSYAPLFCNSADLSWDRCKDGPKDRLVLLRMSWDAGNFTSPGQAAAAIYAPGPLNENVLGPQNSLGADDTAIALLEGLKSGGIEFVKGAVLTGGKPNPKLAFDVVSKAYDTYSQKIFDTRAKYMTTDTIAFSGFSIGKTNDDIRGDVKEYQSASEDKTLRDLVLIEKLVGNAERANSEKAQSEALAKLNAQAATVAKLQKSTNRELQSLRQRLEALSTRVEDSMAKAPAQLAKNVTDPEPTTEAQFKARCESLDQTGKEIHGYMNVGFGVISLFGNEKAKTTIHRVYQAASNGVDLAISVMKIAAGAASGAAMGSVLPGIGTAIGAIVGLVAAFFSSGGGPDPMLVAMTNLQESINRLGKYLSERLDQIDAKLDKILQVQALMYGQVQKIHEKANDIGDLTSAMSGILASLSDYHFNSVQNPGNKAKIITDAYVTQDWLDVNDPNGTAQSEATKSQCVKSIAEVLKNLPTTSECILLENGKCFQSSAIAAASFEPWALFYMNPADDWSNFLRGAAAFLGRADGGLIIDRIAADVTHHELEETLSWIDSENVDAIFPIKNGSTFKENFSISGHPLLASSKKTRNQSDDDSNRRGNMLLSSTDRFLEATDHLEYYINHCGILGSNIPETKELRKEALKKVLDLIIAARSTLKMVERVYGYQSVGADFVANNDQNPLQNAEMRVIRDQMGFRKTLVDFAQFYFSLVHNNDGPYMGDNFTRASKDYFHANRDAFQWQKARTQSGADSDDTEETLLSVYLKLIAIDMGVKVKSFIHFKDRYTKKVPEIGLNSGLYDTAMTSTYALSKAHWYHRPEDQSGEGNFKISDVFLNGLSDLERWGIAMVPNLFEFRLRNIDREGEAFEISDETARRIAEHLGFSQSKTWRDVLSTYKAIVRDGSGRWYIGSIARMDQAQVLYKAVNAPGGAIPSNSADVPAEFLTNTFDLRYDTIPTAEEQKGINELSDYLVAMQGGAPKIDFDRKIHSPNNRNIHQIADWKPGDESRMTNRIDPDTATALANRRGDVQKMIYFSQAFLLDLLEDVITYAGTDSREIAENRKVAIWTKIANARFKENNLSMFWQNNPHLLVPTTRVYQILSNVSDAAAKYRTSLKLFNTLTNQFRSECAHCDAETQNAFDEYQHRRRIVAPTLEDFWDRIHVTKGYLDEAAFGDDQALAPLREALLDGKRSIDQVMLSFFDPMDSFAGVDKMFDFGSIPLVIEGQVVETPEFGLFSWLFSEASPEGKNHRRLQGLLQHQGKILGGVQKLEAIRDRLIGKQ